MPSSAPHTDDIDEAVSPLLLSTAMLPAQRQPETCSSSERSSQRTHAGNPSALVIPMAHAAQQQARGYGSTTEGLPGPRIQQQFSGGTHGNVSVCRICLEEDSLEKLEEPCACSGTQRYVHRTCIQRWIQEKGDITCEICGTEYAGGYAVPPPRPRTLQGILPSRHVHYPLFVLDESGRPVRLSRSSQARREVRRGARRGPNASSDSDDGAGLDEELRACGCRLPSLNCLFTSCVLLLFIVVLNHSATLAARPRPGTPLQLPQQPGVRALPGKDSGAGADADADVDADAAGGRGSAFSWQPRARPQSPKFDLENGPGDAFEAVLMFLFWAFTKFFIIALPLFVFLRVAARQVERRQLEELLRTGSAAGGLGLAGGNAAGGAGQGARRVAHASTIQLSRAPIGVLSGELGDALQPGDGRNTLSSV